MVRGGDDDAVSAITRTVANCPLVETALYGGDPNWGRIIQAVGASHAGTARLPVDISIEGVQVCARGGYVAHDAAALGQAVTRDEVSMRSACPARAPRPRCSSPTSATGTVTINADYTT